MKLHILFIGLSVGLLVTGCASKPETDDDFMAAMFGQPADLQARIDKAQSHPLGSRENPVRVSMPEGEHAYLRRLRCEDGNPPAYERSGSVGLGPYNHILDLYAVKCLGLVATSHEIHMDMYFPDHVETEAPKGLTLAKE